MKTILEVLNLKDLGEDKSELLNLIEDEGLNCRNTGDFLGAGEWLASKLHYVDERQVEEIFSQLVALWASPLEFRMISFSIRDLVSRMSEFVPEELARALVAATLRTVHSPHSIPEAAGDLAFRLSRELFDLFEVSARRPLDMCLAGAAKLEKVVGDLSSAIDSFTNTNCLSAKIASIDVVRKAKYLKKLALPEERPILSETDILLGASFRKFCESCERQETKGIIKRTPDLKEQATRICSYKGPRTNSVIWNLFILPIARHVVKLVDEGSQRSEAATTPSLRLATNMFKLDLSRIEREMTFCCRLLNEGEGQAMKVRPEFDLDRLPIDIEIIEPKVPFQVGGESAQTVTFALTLKEKTDGLTIPIRWKCATLTDRIHTDSEQLMITQQHVEPDWDRLLQDPPYTTNPIKKRENLFGRDAIFQTLTLHASGGISTFLWGQKRVGKTSVLQVLASELQKTNEFVCLLFRIGELKPLHEGQIAHRIAERLCADSRCTVPVPSEATFGGGLGGLVPFAEKLIQASPGLKFVVIIDEFEDLNPAFYTGERGKQFVKALRSLSEIGLTFFLAGSERMNTIYRRHELDLNKWVNLSLDCIESREDCKALVMKPVAGAIEYQPECVDFIVNYCGRNPFYMHLLCLEIFKQCWQERRTYVGESDLENVRHALLRTFGPTNFSHFWDDNPELDELQKTRQAAENCLVLRCLFSLGGTCESVEELFGTEELLDLGPSERMSSRSMRIATERLQNRGVILTRRTSGKIEISLPIFGDWLLENAELKLLPRWRDFCRRQELMTKEPEREIEIPLALDSSFPITEEDLFTVSQSLIYCGKQKDVYELRIWLKQFNDDNRIEIAFLLLRRLVEKGFVNEGAMLLAMEKLQQALEARRLEIGKRAWRMFRGRKDNFCITFVDSETKSGATVARELSKRLRPGKLAPAGAIHDWMKSHSEEDSLVLIVDDFLGTGSTLFKGLGKFFEERGSEEWMDVFLTEGRILCYSLYSFPEALEKLRHGYPKVEFFSANVFGNEVRALDPQANIFANDEEIEFARKVLIEIGRELTPQTPLGFGDMGALVAFYNSIPNNSLPIFWSGGTVSERPWRPLFPRA